MTEAVEPDGTGQDRKQYSEEMVLAALESLLPQILRYARAATHQERLSQAQSALQGAVMSLYDSKVSVVTHDALTKRLLKSAGKRIRTKYNHDYGNAVRELPESRAGVNVEALKSPAAVNAFSDVDCRLIVEETIRTIQPDTLRRVAELMIGGADKEIIAAEMGWSLQHTGVQIKELQAQVKRINLRDAHQ